MCEKHLANKNDLKKNIGTNPINREKLQLLGLELVEPQGDSDGRIIDPKSGEYITFFETKDKYAVFLPSPFVKKFAPGFF